MTPSFGVLGSNLSFRGWRLVWDTGSRLSRRADPPADSVEPPGSAAGPLRDKEVSDAVRLRAAHSRSAGRTGRPDAHRPARRGARLSLALGGGPAPVSARAADPVSGHRRRLPARVLQAVHGSGGGPDLRCRAHAPDHSRDEHPQHALLPAGRARAAARHARRAVRRTPPRRPRPGLVGRRARSGRGGSEGARLPGRRVHSRC